MRPQHNFKSPWSTEALKPHSQNLGMWWHDETSQGLGVTHPYGFLHWLWTTWPFYWAGSPPCFQQSIMETPCAWHLQLLWVTIAVWALLPCFTHNPSRSLAWYPQSFPQCLAFLRNLAEASVSL